MTTTTAPRIITPRKKLLSNEVFGMLVFVFTEIMFFAGLMSACIVIKASNRFSWIPPETVKLPVAATGFNTFILMMSGVLAVFSALAHKKSNPKALSYLIGAIMCGSFFVTFQGVEWVNLLNYGMSMQASVFSAFFFLLIGAHGLHAIAGVIGLLFCLKSLKRKTLTPEALLAGVIFWLLVVAIWPNIYIFMYF